MEKIYLSQLLKDIAVPMEDVVVSSVAVVVVVVAVAAVVAFLYF